MTDSKDEYHPDGLRGLLEYVTKNSYKVRENDVKAEKLVSNCLNLFRKDYKFSCINNDKGELCSHYPSSIVILEYMISESDKIKGSESVESLYDVQKLKELFNKAKFARCRGRFAVPVILFEGKHICRGATISGGAEIYGRSSLDFFFSGGESIPNPNEEGNSAEASSSNELFNRIRGQDIKVLKEFSVGYICDLMVEKKKVKFGMNVTSSEKVDKENRYSDFKIIVAPYPGCEFFKEWRENGYMAEGMMFDWNQGFVDAHLDIPSNLSPPQSVDWSKYRSWDLVALTQNYLKLLLHYVKEGESGLLVHCISGWDRTPLYISLLRLSMWADGAIHTSLSAAEIVYLTIAYDWFLFGHNFPDRIGKGEEIFFFCFNFLKYITAEDFSVWSRKRRTVSRTDSECYIDGVMLDTEFHRSSNQGSTTSINSSSSLNSTKSSVDNAPIYFNVGSPEEESFLHNNGTSMSYTPARPSPASKNAFEVSSHKTLSSSHTTYHSTSPMAVPSAVRKLSDTKNNSSCGSWQMISGTGSLRDSTSPHESPLSAASEPTTAHNAANGNQRHQECQETVMEDSPRKQRLDAARRLFLTIYSPMIGVRPSPDSSGGGFSGMLENFAEKVGFRASRSSVV